MDYGIWLPGSEWDSDTVVEKNTLTNDGIGIILEDGADPTIQNDRIKNFGWLDIYYGSFAARRGPDRRPQKVALIPATHWPPEPSLGAWLLRPAPATLDRARTISALRL